MSNCLFQHGKPWPPGVDCYFLKKYTIKSPVIIDRNPRVLRYESGIFWTFDIHSFIFEGNAKYGSPSTIRTSPKRQISNFMLWLSVDVHQHPSAHVQGKRHRVGSNHSPWSHTRGTGKRLHAWGSRKFVPLVNGYDYPKKNQEVIHNFGSVTKTMNSKIHNS